MTRILLLIAASSLALASCGKPANPNTDTDGVAGSETAASQDASSAANGMAGGNTDAMGTAGNTDAMGAGGTTDAMGAGMATGAQDYVAQAAASDQFEIQSSEMVLRQTKNEGVRAFAKQMVSEHSASTKTLMGVIKTASLTAPGTGLRGSQQTNLAALRDAAGNMDQLYIDQQRAAHAEAIALHQGAAKNSAMPAQLTVFANEVLPRIKEHARMLADMKVMPARS